MNDFASDSSIETPEKIIPKYQQILRWLAVLPVGILGLLIGMVLVNIAVLFFGWFGGENIQESGYYKIIYWIVSPFIGGMLAVYWSARVAPDFKKIVATIIAGLVLVIDVLSTTLSIYTGEYPIIWLMLQAISMAAGAGYKMYKIYEDEKNFEFWDNE